MNILGYYPLPLISYTHDASAAIVNSEKGILYAYEEERLCRSQYAIAETPKRSTFLGLKQLSLKPHDIDSLVFVSMNKCCLSKSFNNRVQFIKDLFLLKDKIEVSCLPHHLAHSSLSVLTSPFDECGFITMDGGGDGIMGHCGVFTGNKFQIIEEFEFSPAILFGYASCLGGFSLFEEGKLMGLSAYGQIDKPLYNWFSQNFWIEDGSSALTISPKLSLQWDADIHTNNIDANTFRHHKYHRLRVLFNELNVEKRPKMIPPMNIAATAQHFFQELIVKAIHNLVERTQIRNISLGGGAFQNVLTNGILQERLGINTFIPVAPHDAGLSLGAALYKRYENNKKRSLSVPAYLGPSFKEEEAIQEVSRFGLNFQRFKENIATTIAHEISNGQIVGCFQGRAEFGARALGGRSVLADPRFPDSKARLNQVLKRRDWFMPYAPTVLEEFGHIYFSDFVPTPYMNRTFQVLPKAFIDIPAAVHTNNTSRVQSINEEQNPFFYSIIKEFYFLTGIPVLLNTSFNKHGTPMVATPRHAIEHLLEGCIDLLVIENIVITSPRETQIEDLYFEERCYIQWERLKWITKLLIISKETEARSLLKKLNLPIQITDKAIWQNASKLWDRDQNLSKLSNWWFKEYNKHAKSAPSKTSEHD